MREAAISGRESRRDRHTRDKRRRIFDAASTLFAREGFSNVTTQAISDRADIATGTLFRYAASKNDLLLLVYNKKLREALKIGADRAHGVTDLVDAIVALAAPLLELGNESAENGVTYQRELLFGTPTDTYRLEGLGLIAGLEADLAERLSREASRLGLPTGIEAARLAASSIFAVTHLVISRQSTGAHPGHPPLEDLRSQIRQIIAGYFATLPRFTVESVPSAQGDR